MVSIFVFTIIDQFFSSCVMVWMIFYLVFLGTPENSNGGEYHAHYILFLVFCIWFLVVWCFTGYTFNSLLLCALSLAFGLGRDGGGGGGASLR